MTTIAQINNYPDGTPVDSIQGRLKVFERRSINTKYGPTTAQKASLEDVAGERMRLDVWGHPDLMPMDGMEVVLFSGGKGGKGVRVKHGSFKKKDTQEVVNTIELDVNKYGQFQTVEIYRSTVAPATTTVGAPQTPVKANPSPSEAQGVATPPPQPQNPVKGLETALTGKQPVRGDKIGMALNNATHLVVALVEQGQVPADLMKDIGHKASDIIRLSTWLEAGNLYPKSEAVKEGDPF